eukprot:6469988-Amphidinium_carterae.4
MQTVEDYYRDTCIDNEDRRLEHIQRKVRQRRKRMKRKVQPWRRTIVPQQETYGGFTNYRGQGEGKYTNGKGRPYQVRGKGGGYTNYNSRASYGSHSTTYGRPNPRYYSNKGKSRGRKSKGKNKGPPLPGDYHNNKEINHTNARAREKVSKRVRLHHNATCGRVGRTAPNCWRKGQTYAIDQDAPVTELPTNGLDTITKNNLTLQMQGYSVYLSNGRVNV